MQRKVREMTIIVKGVFCIFFNILKPAERMRKQFQLPKQAQALLSSHSMMKGWNTSGT